jgi:hypothetical protein
MAYDFSFSRVHHRSRSRSTSHLTSLTPTPLYIYWVMESIYSSYSSRIDEHGCWTCTGDSAEAHIFMPSPALDEHGHWISSNSDEDNLLPPSPTLLSTISYSRHRDTSNDYRPSLRANELSTDFVAEAHLAFKSCMQDVFLPSISSPANLHTIQQDGISEPTCPRLPCISYSTPSLHRDFRTPSRSSPHQPTLPATSQHRAFTPISTNVPSMFATPRNAGVLRTPSSLGTDPVERRFPDPFPHLRDQDLFGIRSSRPFTGKSTSAHRPCQTIRPKQGFTPSPSPLTPIAECINHDSSPVSSPLSNPLVNESQEDSKSSFSSTLSSPEYLPSSASSCRLSTLAHDASILQPLPALHIPASLKSTSLASRNPSFTRRGSQFRDRSNENESLALLPSLRKRKANACFSSAELRRRGSKVARASTSASTSTSSDSTSFTPLPVDPLPLRRDFPSDVPINEDFQQLYRRFPASSFLSSNKAE